MIVRPCKTSLSWYGNLSALTCFANLVLTKFYYCGNKLLVSNPEEPAGDPIYPCTGTPFALTNTLVLLFDILLTFILSHPITQPSN